MNFIIDILSSALGLLMDVFFQGLTLIGYPRLWACIVLYAVFTRLFFLPQRIGNYKSTLLMPVVRRELLSVDPSFFEKTKDKELTVKRAALKKQIYKKYKISNSSGCLMTLIQYPFLVALFYVVKNPQEFVPSLETLSNVTPQVNTFLGISLSAIPLDNISFNNMKFLFLCVPLIIVISNVVKMLPTLKKAKTVSNKIIVYSLFSLMVFLLGWLSAKLPIAISLYWLTNDITYMVFDFFIHKYLPKNKVISTILKYYNDEISKNNTPVDIEENTVEDNILEESTVEENTQVKPDEDNQMTTSAQLNQG